MNWDVVSIGILLGGGVLHALIVVVGIYVAINTRLTRLETRMEVLWKRFEQWLDRNGG